ncbi:MAG TPA: hypothetical protein VKG38_14595 [Solirubrobacteraceae bacterium]|nr:hypothetical protein [Solirubrobacteraceae bacterium]
MAGAVAEELRFGAPMLTSYAGDARQAAELVAEGKEKRGREKAAERARAILRENWPSVEWIAKVAETTPFFGCPCGQGQPGDRVHHHVAPV